MAELDNVKVGDKLYISCRGDSRIDIVTRVTKTQVIAGKTRFRKKDGCTMSGSWNLEYARPASEEDELYLQEKKRRAELIHACRHIKLRVLPHLNLKVSSHSSKTSKTIAKKCKYRPSLTWESGPLEVTITIKPKKQ